MTAERIFVAGATGVIGRRVVRRLVESGHHVVGTTRTQAGEKRIAALGARPVRVDAYDAEGMNAAVAEARPDVVIHQLTDLSDYDLAANGRIRREGTANLMAAAAAAGAGRIIAQSIAWAYAPTRGPAGEDAALDLSDETRRDTVTAVQALEHAVLAAPAGIVLRYGMLYGPDTWFTPQGRQAQAARAHALVADDSVTSFIHVDDAAQAAVQALAWPAGPVNVVDDDPAPASDWVPNFCRFVGAPEPEYRPARAAWACGASNARARSRDWAPRHPTWRDNWGSS